MKEGQNYNHPQKGSCITVEPIRSLKKIEEIKSMLKPHPRNYCLFVVGINTGLRASDLVNLRVAQVKNLQPMGKFFVQEKKKRKRKFVVFNKVCTDAIQRLLESREYKDDDFLFLGQRGTLTTISIHQLVKSWCKKAGLTGNYGSHTLRKTFGFIKNTVQGVKLHVLTQAFNHSREKETLTYLCIQPEEVEAMYAKEI